MLPQRVKCNRIFFRNDSEPRFRETNPKHSHKFNAFKSPPPPNWGEVCKFELRAAQQKLATFYSKFIQIVLAVAAW